MRKFTPGIYWCAALVVLAACRKPYLIPAITAPASYLVVEGIINSGSDSTIIKLSKTVNISNKTTVNPVLNALLTVESNKGGNYPLAAIGQGKYGSPGLNLDNTLKYRLRIKTADNREYLSDFVPVLNSPAVDTVSYGIRSNGIQIFTGTHDPQNSTHYYRWEYQETWVIHSHYYSFYQSNGDTVTERDLVNNQVYQCWQSDTSNVIVLASSANLTKDVISNLPVTFVESTSPKLDGSQSIIVNQYAPSTSAYSILVKQYALTSDAYNFYVNLKKNTEQLGSIFDAQPSQNTGNIHSVTSPSEPVIGYISAGTTTSKRIFITNQQIPAAWLPNFVYSDCKLDSVYLYTVPRGSAVAVNEEDEYFNYNKKGKYYAQQIPIAVLFNPLNGKVIGHTGSSRECVDCTLRGTNKRPVFWK
ncbi:MAG: hypothetical protein JWP94_2292 [Mucilaginibacter sp.]|nr:hypothetical protein [Mucilaginibacter sp.]